MIRLNREVDIIFVLGYIFIVLLGSFLHFTYDLSNHNKTVALFSAVNESTWEHIKLGLTPYLIWTVIDGIKYFNNPNFFVAKTLGALTIIIMIPLLFYGYKIFTKKSILFVDISIFFVTILLVQIINYIVLNMKPFSNLIRNTSMYLFVLIIICYLLLTFFPIKSFLFKDPITKKYGLKGHK